MTNILNQTRNEYFALSRLLIGENNLYHTMATRRAKKGKVHFMQSMS